jgi:hypothetical protein
MASENQTVSEYIVHHLTNLTFGKLPEGFERYDGSVVSEGGAWVMAHGGAEASAMGFNAIHVDSMIWSIGLGIIFCWLFRGVAKKAEAGVPSGMVNAMEMIVEFVDGTVRDTFHGRNPLVAPLALTGRPDSRAVGPGGYRLPENRALHRPQYHHGHGCGRIYPDAVLLDQGKRLWFREGVDPQPL